MVINVPKPDEELLEMLSDSKRVFIVACGGCPVGCDSGGQERVNALAQFLSGKGREITGSTLIDFLCNKALVGTRLSYHLGELRKADSVLVVSCGIGVQATGNMVDMPAFPANDTLSAQGMQGLWPSVERCAGCGTCYLGLTGGICPITTCSKGLLNGMCGGQHEGKCEVEQDRDCGWYLIFQRLKDLDQLDNLKKIPHLRDYRKLDVPDTERKTTRWALEKSVIYEAPQNMKAGKEAQSE